MLPGPGGSAEEEVYAPTYYPGTLDPARAAGLDVHPGDELRGIDLTVAVSGAVRIRGHVLNSILGQPGKETYVYLWPHDAPPRVFSPHVPLDDRGNFEIRGVLPGSYTLVAEWVREKKVYGARVRVDVGDADLEGLNLVIAPGADLDGRVRVKGTGDLNVTDLRVWLQSSEGAPIYGSAEAAVKPDGTFVIHDVLDGSYSLSVSPLRQGFYLKAAHAGAEDILNGELNVVRGKDMPTLEVVISAAGGSVDGRVLDTDSLPVNGAVVVLVPDGRRRPQPHWYRTATTDQYGRFALNGVAPGEYRLFAWEDLEPGAYLDPDFLRPVEKQGQTVAIEEAGRYSIELKVIPAETQRSPM